MALDIVSQSVLFATAHSGSGDDGRMTSKPGGGDKVTRSVGVESGGVRGESCGGDDAGFAGNDLGGVGTAVRCGGEVIPASGGVSDTRRVLDGVSDCGGTVVVGRRSVGFGESGVIIVGMSGVRSAKRVLAGDDAFGPASGDVRSTRGAEVGGSRTGGGGSGIVGVGTASVGVGISGVGSTKRSVAGGGGIGLVSGDVKSMSVGTAGVGTAGVGVGTTGVGVRTTGVFVRAVGVGNVTRGGAGDVRTYLRGAGVGVVREESAWCGGDVPATGGVLGTGCVGESSSVFSGVVGVGVSGVVFGVVGVGVSGVFFGVSGVGAPSQVSDPRQPRRNSAESLLP
ncbi:uncharacterized protein LOC134529989 [Bacillus rossius redtenbacheri]|uniref:uncharacterized protein LOC134529989 n=1 Tax=Bacillus rossius redtenbacheri TaxID=93214 RepID=UPI002FDCC8F1